MNKYRNSNLNRADSTGSLPSNLSNEYSPSIATVTDDEDSDGRSGTHLSYKERRREAHTQAEQKRRDAIKKGYEYLQDLVPTVSAEDGSSSSSGAASSAKASKAVVLHKAIDYIQYVEGQKRKQEAEISCLKKELAALQIMRDNYEQLVRAHQSSTAGGNAENGSPDDVAFVPSEVKFRVFQMLMDTLFNSFNEKVGMSNFGELSRCVISWLEEQCTPHMLQEMMLNILDQVKSEANEAALS